MKFTDNPGKYSEELLDWAEERMAYHHDSEDWHNCLAIAEEWHEWFVAKKGDDVDFIYTKYPLANIENN